MKTFYICVTTEYFSFTRHTENFFLKIPALYSQYFLPLIYSFENWSFSWLWSVCPCVFIQYFTYKQLADEGGKRTIILK